MFAIDIPFLKLDDMYETQQAYRWNKLTDSIYLIPHMGQATKVEQQSGSDKVLFSCSSEEFYSIWFNYFDLQTDYSNVNYRIRQVDQYLKVCSVRAKGIRVLRRDFSEVIITEALLYGVDKSLHKQILEDFVKTFGERKQQAFGNAGRKIWYEFPSAFTIVENEKKFNQLFDSFNPRNRKRFDRVLYVCKKICDNCIADALTSSFLLDDINETILYLKHTYKLPTILANKVCLYGIGRHDALQIDKRIDVMLEEELECDYDTFVDWYLLGLKEHSGIAQTYMLYNTDVTPKEVQIWGL